MKMTTFKLKAPPGQRFAPNRSPDSVPSPIKRSNPEAPEDRLRLNVGDGACNARAPFGALALGLSNEYAKREK